MLKERQIPIAAQPDFRYLSGRELIELIGEPASDEETQRLLDHVTIHIYRLATKGENPVLVPLKKVASPFRRHDLDPFANSLERQGVPFGGFVRQVHTGPQEGSSAIFLWLIEIRSALERFF